MKFLYTSLIALIFSGAALNASTDTGPINSFEEVQMIFDNVGDILYQMRKDILRLENKIENLKSNKCYDQENLQGEYTEED